MRGSRPARGLGALALLGLALHVSGATEAAFAVSTGTPAMSLSSATDWRAPLVTGAVARKAEGGIPGFIRQGAGYRVHAAVVDDPSSRPASGVGTVTAGITGVQSMGLPVGPATIEGLEYTHQTPLRSESYAPAGTYSAWVRAADLATPTNTSADYPLQVVVDNDTPAGQSLTIANGSGTARRPDLGDRITFTWDEIVDPDSVQDGWTGAVMDVTVRITDSALAAGDLVTVWNSANTAQLPLGQVALGGNYVSATTSFGGPGTATRSTITWVGSGTGLTVVLGTQTPTNSVINGSSTVTTVTWTPATGVFDRAGNRSSTTAVVESGPADREF